MSDWPAIPLGQLCEVAAGGTPSRAVPSYFGGGIPWVKIGDMLQGVVTHTEETISELALANSAAKKLPAGTVLISIFATIGRTAVLGIEAATNQAIAGITPKNSEQLDSRYLRHYLDSLVDELNKRARGVAQLNINSGVLRSLLVPVPAMEEQRRIATILDQAEALRAQRRAAIAQLDSLGQAIFVEMFGAPLANPKCFPVKVLPDVCALYSGGTPSKAVAGNWTGTLPWFSAKDMKSSDLFDSIDHIDAKITERTSLRKLPANTVAIVVRGMILAHTFPVCVLRTPSTINQDLKALIPKQDIDAQFLAHCLRAQADHALQLVSEAGHGTKRLDAKGLANIEVLLPPIELQRKFGERVREIEAMKTRHVAALTLQDALFASLQHRAFRGELTRRASTLEELQKLEAEAGLEALIFVAKRTAKHDLYVVGKTLYMADKHHLEQHGRLVYGETHEALPMGPVPKAAYDTVKFLRGEQLFSGFDEAAARAAIRVEGKTRLVPLREADLGKLGADAVQSLEWAIRYMDGATFAQAKAATHDAAWQRTAPNAAIALAHLIDTLPAEARQRHWGL